MNNKSKTTDFIINVHKYLDHALTANESKDFIQDVHNNPLLAKILNEERNLRITIKNHLQRPKVEKSFIKMIKDSLYS